MSALAGGKLGAWFAGHQLAAGAAAVGGVAGLALWRRRRSSASSSGARIVTAAAPQPQAVADTTATDLYNQLQPQIEANNSALAQQLAQLQATIAANAVGANSPMPGNFHLTDPVYYPTPIAAPAPPPAPTPQQPVMVFDPKFGYGVDTGERGVSSGPVSGTATPDFLAFRSQQPTDVQNFLDAIGSGKVQIVDGKVFGSVK